MEISNIKIKKLIPNKGHVGFVSCIIDNWLYIGNIAIFTRLNSEELRLVFPEKKIRDKKISLFYPVTTETYYKLEKIISDKFKKYG